MRHCAFCDNDAMYVIEETDTPLCIHCQELYTLGKENQGTVKALEDYGEDES